MASEKTTLKLVLRLLFCLAICEAGVNRCLFTNGDPHCDVAGQLPLRLSCSYPGKWFTVKSVSKQDNAGGWQQVSAAKSTAEQLCKASRVHRARVGSNCTVSGSLPKISAQDVVKVEYYCWEVDPDLLGGFGGGFGKRSHLQLKNKILHRARGF